MCRTRTQCTHDRKKLEVFTTIGKILAYTNHTTPTTLDRLISNIRVAIVARQSKDTCRTKQDQNLSLIQGATVVTPFAWHMCITGHSVHIHNLLLAMYSHILGGRSRYAFVPGSLKFGIGNLPDLPTSFYNKKRLISFLAQLRTKMHDFPPKKLSQFLPFYPIFSEMHHILGVLQPENLVFCCSPLHAFFSYLRNSLFTPLVSKMRQNDTIFLFVLRGLAIRDMQQRNSLQLHTASEHSETSKNRMQSISTFCALRREAFGMRGLAILTVALRSV